MNHNPFRFRDLTGPQLGTAIQAKHIQGLDAFRALAVLFAPPDRLAEFCGLWTLAVRLSAIVGPITYGLVTVASSGNHRLAIFSTGLFFVLGLVLLRRVDVTRGAAAAMRAAQK